MDFIIMLVLLKFGNNFTAHLRTFSSDIHTTFSVSCVWCRCVVRVLLTRFLQMLGFCISKNKWIQFILSVRQYFLRNAWHTSHNSWFFWSLSLQMWRQATIFFSCFLSSLSGRGVYVWTLTRPQPFIDGWLEQAAFWGSRVAQVDFGGALVTL